MKKTFIDQIFHTYTVDSQTRGTMSKLLPIHVPGFRVPIPARLDVLTVDLPWAYGSARNGPDKSRTAERHYETVGNAGREVNRRTGEGVQALIDLVPVALWAEGDSHLYLWTTNPKLPFAFSVMEAWGFTYKTTITWVKTRKDGGPIKNGMGFFFRGATEHCLFGVRGRKPIPPELREPNVIFAARGEHSEKPQAFYELVERVSPGRRADIFARVSRPNWWVWGKGVGVVGAWPEKVPNHAIGT